MSYEYYNPSAIDYLREKTCNSGDEPDPKGCWWRILIMLLICILLALCRR